MIPLQWQFLAKFIGILAVTMLSAYGAWYATSDHYQAIIAAERLADQQIVNAQLVRNQQQAAERAAKIRESEERHAKDQLVVNRLNAQLAGVRIKLPGHDCNAVSGRGQAGTGSDGSTGMAASRANEYLAEAQREIQAIGQRCAQLNIDAIAANDQK